MKKIIAIVFAGALTLAGCNSVTPTPAPTVTPSVNDIQRVVVTACGFLPAVTTIANIISASPTVMTATEIAGLVCKAVTTKSARKGGYAPKSVIVGNKVILLNGEFVK